MAGDDRVPPTTARVAREAEQRLMNLLECSEFNPFKVQRYTDKWDWCELSHAHIGQLRVGSRSLRLEVAGTSHCLRIERWEGASKLSGSRTLPECNTYRHELGPLRDALAWLLRGPDQDTGCEGAK